MNSLDIFIAIPLAYAVIRGFIKGFVMEVFSFVAFIVAIIACLCLTSLVMEKLSGVISNSYMLPFISYLLVFICAFLLVIWLGKSIEMLVKVAQMGMLNRIFGVVVSTLKMCFFLSLFLWVADMAHIFREDTEEGSYSYTYLHGFAPLVVSGITDHIPFLSGTVTDIEGFFSNIKPQITEQR